MKAVRFTAPNEPLVYTEELPVPEPPEGGAVVKLAYAGVCHSDVHIWEGGFQLEDGNLMKDPFATYPCTPGHEMSGYVHSVGEGAETDLKPGDSVIVYPWISCNACTPCKDGHNIFCNGTGPRVFLGVTQDGGYAEYVAVPDVRYLVPARSVPLHVASILPCSGLTAYHAVDEGVEFVKSVTKIKGVCSVLSISAGGVGQWALPLARALYPPGTQIICADRKQVVLDAVVRNVPDIVPLLISKDESADDIGQRVKSLSSLGNGVDLVLDFVGATDTYKLGRNSLAPQGHYHVIGLLGGEASFVFPDMVFHGLVMKGIFVGSLVQLRKLVELVTNKPEVYSHLLYKVHPLKDGVQVLEDLKRGKVVGRAILRCNEDK